MYDFAQRFSLYRLLPELIMSSIFKVGCFNLFLGLLC
jgi:hypothetical protein